MQRPSQVEDNFKEYQRVIIDAKYKVFIAMNGILSTLRGYRELSARTRLAITAGRANLNIPDFGAYQLPVQLWEQEKADFENELVANRYLEKSEDL